MSKRFGRNQKRRMREQIEALEKDLHNHKCWLYQERQLAARNRQIVAETAEVLGRDFMTLNPIEQEVRDLNALMPNWRVHIPGAQSYRFDQNDREPQYGEFVETVLPVLLGSIRFSHLCHRVHIEFTYAGKHVGYAIATDSLLQLPRAWAVRRIANEMAKQLISQLGEVPA